MTDNVSKMTKQFEQVLDLLQKRASAQMSQQSSQQASDEATKESQQPAPKQDNSVSNLNYPWTQLSS